jgi:hypothetical protein
MQESYLTSLKEATTTSSSAISPVAVGGGKEKKKVVVIGAGWGGLSAAFELAKRCVINVGKSMRGRGSQNTKERWSKNSKEGGSRRESRRETRERD